MHSDSSPLALVPCFSLGKWARYGAASLALCSIGLSSAKGSDFTTAGNGSWTASGTWTKTNSTNDHTYPQSGDSIIGNSGDATITMDTGSYAVDSVAIGASSVLFRPVNTSSSTVNLNVSGNFTKGAGGGTFSLRNNSNALMNVDIGGNLAVNSGALQFGSASGGQNLNSLTVDGSTTIASTATLNLRTTTVASFQSVTVDGVVNIANFGGAGASVTSLAGSTVGAIIQTNSGSNTSGALSITGTSGSASYAGILRDASPTSTGGVLSISKLGAGTQTFSGTTNTYTGTTQVSGGTLLINGSHTGGANYTVTGNASGAATLGGGGSIVLASGQSVTISSSSSTNKGILAPGTSSTSPVTLTLGSSGVATDLIFGANSQLSINVGAATASSRISLFGDIDLSGSSDSLSLTSLAGAWDGSTYIIASYTGTLNGIFDSISGLDSNYFIDYGSGTNSVITLQAVPEPGSVALLALAGGLFWTVLGRRRKIA